MAYTNEAGLGVTNHYGARKTEARYGGEYVTKGSVKEHVIRFNFAEVPNSGFNTNPKFHFISKDATILSARLVVREAFAGGTSYQVGVYKLSDGTAIDADGLITATEAAIANLGTVGAAVIGKGALIGTKGPSEAFVVGVTGTGTFTAGDAEIVIEYADAPPAPQPR